ncbi:hypothetical protein CHS0354_034343 [Potamilus streckersoni]|uniref:Uncharacterized protein n=1 Tax=Potamilus streckersoni TaxID=2493646 RepID=A0AAE0TK10_9BIVA|nr:hypothetical protein CHS0354_034343 [Potamilus streckersoni]
MADRNLLLEKKVKFLGSWVNDRVTKDVMGKILHLIQSEKGSKVKLQLNRDGLRVMKYQIISGMAMQTFIPLKNIYFITVNQNVPRLLFVVAKDMHTYQIYTFKCENALDAGMFIQGLRDLRKTVHSVSKIEHDGINWTLRSKTEDDKRQLNTLVDIYGGKAVVQVNSGDINQPPVPTGHRFQKQKEKTIPGEQFHKMTMDKTAKPVLATRNADTNMKVDDVNAKTRTFSNGTTFSDSASEVSESALRSELESLSNELRDIKLMLEKSTGINPDKMEKHNNKDALDAVVVPDDEDKVDTNTEVVRRPKTESKTKPVQNGHTDNGLVRVSVPDYRYSLKQRTTKGTDSTDSSGYNSFVSSTVDTSKAPSTTYEDWKNRVEWRSHTNSSMRPRSNTLGSSVSNHDQNRPEILRAKRQTIGYKMVNDPRFSMAHNQPKSATLRLRTCTTIERPIENVYRRHGHHSVVLRHTNGSDRQKILSVAPENGYFVEPINDDLIIQTDMFEDPKTKNEISTPRDAVIRI